MRQKNNKEYFLAALIILGLTFIIFWKFFFRELYPFPGDFLLAWYEPWKTQFFENGTITLAHKPIADDVFRQIYPFKILASDLLKHFSLPLWNPYNGAGMPLLATMHIGFLTPFNLFFVFLPNFLAWSLYIMVQPLLLGIFTYIYCRKIRLSSRASIFSTVTFIFSGFVITRLIFGEYIYTFSMLPLILYLVESSIQNPKNKIILFLPLTILFMFISGQPQIILYVVIFCFLYLLFRYQQLKKYYPSKNTLLILSLFGIGVGLSAIQILPTLELFFQANINNLSSQFIFQRFLLPIQHLITIFIPNYFGNQATYNYWGSADYIETVASIGLIPCFFVLFSFGKINPNQIDVRRFFYITIILTILSTLDWFGTRFLFSLPIPIISTGIPSRVFSLTTFSIAILAGFGFDRWVTEKDLKKIINQVVLFASLVLIFLIATFIFYKTHVSCNNKFILDCRNIALRNTILEVVGFLIFTSLFFLYIKYQKNMIHKLIPFTVLLLIIIIGVYNSNKFLPFSKKETFLPQNNLITSIKNKTLDARVFGMGEAFIKTDFATHFRFFDPNFYDPLYNKRFGELVWFANTGNIFSVLPRSDVEINSQIELEIKAQQRRDRLLSIFSVKYLIFRKAEVKNINLKKIIWKDNNWVLVENTDALPRIFMVSNVEIVNNQKESLKKLFDFSTTLNNVALLEKMPNEFKSLKNSQNLILDWKINNIIYEPNKITFSTTSKTDKLLVLNDNYYPGWKAFIDNKQVQIYRANYTFRGVVVPSGNHLVKFSYEPLVVRLGAFISGLFVILYLVLVIRKKKLLNI